MKKAFLVLAALALAAGGYKTADAANTITDSRDGKKYKTVKIGKQVWMAENLNYGAEGSKCYGDDPANCKKYGRLYDWETAKKACPAGWRLPNYKDWETLKDFASGNGFAGKKLKANSGWNARNEDCNGTDEFSFSALPGGYGSSDGSFSNVGYSGHWWSATEVDDDHVDARGMYCNEESSVHASYFDKGALSSVRCVQGTGEQTRQRKVEDIDIAKIFGKEKGFPYGMLGANAQRMGIVFLSTKRIDKNKYEITGKSKLKNNICDFTGTIEAQRVIDKVTKLGERVGYADGMITGKYHFAEDKNQKGTGVFEGTFEIYLAGVDIASFEDKSSVLFDGTWKSNRAEASKPLKACWGSGYESECAPADFYLWVDGPEPERYVNKKYLSAGWEYAYSWPSAYSAYSNEQYEEHRKKAEKYEKEWTNWWKK